MLNIVNRHQSILPQYFKEGAMLLIDKPLEWTSFDVVNKIRYAIRGVLQVKKYKVGHAGTLDPLATGLLILCIGPYTKRIDEIVAYHKGYDGEVTLGMCTPSYDAETAPDVYYPDRLIDAEDIEEVRQRYLGRIQQLPPMYSAIKVKGQKLYQLARRGKEIKLESRSLEIYDLRLDLIGTHKLDLSVSCSKGTYIRSLAKDIGECLKTGGYLTRLRRTEIGQYSVKDALSVHEIVDMIQGLHIPNCQATNK